MKRAWLIKPTLLIVFIAITYLPTFVWMWERWFAQESYYGHGILVPLVSLYIVWQRRNLLRRVRLDGENSGLIILAFGLFIHIICALLKIYFLSGFSFVFVIYGMVLFFLGKEIAGNLFFPIFFLLAMIPLPLVLIGNLTVKLKLFAAQCATFALNRVGFPSILEGNIIRMPNSYTVVGAPCSGLRSLISLLTLGVLFALSLKVSYCKKCLLFLSALPLAMATNILRIIILSMVNDLYGEKAALGFIHDFSGFLVFALAFLGLFTVSRMLEAKRNKDEK